MKIIFIIFFLFFTTTSFATSFKGKFIQGGFIIGQTEAGSKVTIDKKQVKVTKEGFFVFGLGRDRKYDVIINVENNGEKEKIVKKVLIVNKFYKNFLNKNISYAVTGINPHCESKDKNNEEKKIIIPAIKILKKNKINIEGPLPADTIFLKQNLKKYDVIIGMYHDQVLTPIKTIYGFEAINITLGLPFIRISPDHGPNYQMLGKNKSSPTSLIQAFKFINKFVKI